MVLKMQTRQGEPVHLDLPSAFLPAVVALLGIAVSFAAWMAVQIVENQRSLTSHEERIVGVERRVEQGVTYREMDAIIQRMDRIEVKLDRALEER